MTKVAPGVEPCNVETYQQPRQGWTCFHCGEAFHVEQAAAAHFGPRPSSRPACLLTSDDVAEIRTILGLSPTAPHSEILAALKEVAP